METPQTNGVIGEVVATGKSPITGRFLPGNKFSKGNPDNRAVMAFRAAVHECVTLDDLRKAVRKLVECAHAGEPWAIRELLDRCAGKTVTPVEIVGQNDDPVEMMTYDELNRLAERARNRGQGSPGADPKASGG